jgi:hypothetical protein
MVKIVAYLYGCDYCEQIFCVNLSALSDDCHSIHYSPSLLGIPYRVSRSLMVTSAFFMRTWLLLSNSYFCASCGNNLSCRFLLSICLIESYTLYRFKLLSTWIFLADCLFQWMLRNCRRSLSDAHLHSNDFIKCDKLTFKVSICNNMSNCDRIIFIECDTH